MLNARADAGKEGSAASASNSPSSSLNPIAAACLAWASNPALFSLRVTVLMTSLAEVVAQTAWQSCGVKTEPVITPVPDDQRFADPIWATSPYWHCLAQSYLLWSRGIEQLVRDSPGLDDRAARCAAFGIRKWANAASPTNFFLTNPVAWSRSLESNGTSIWRGTSNFLADLRAGELRTSSPDDFVVGKDIAITTGTVVYRNDLLEILHYPGGTKSTRWKTHREIPIVIVTPWINKYYILDLTPANSMVRYLTSEGYSVFVTSWKNPGPDLSEASFDDYLGQGVHQLVETARQLTGAKKVHAVGYCIGGTALASYIAWANARFPKEDVPVAHWTLLTTLTDFGEPGDIEVYINETNIRYLDHRMALTGFLGGQEMSFAFRSLRANTLIWHYAVTKYLYGEAVRPNPVMFWNSDTTRMPARMHSWYLRELYLHNLLVRPGALELCGESIDLGRIAQPLYCVGANDDHIVPWRQCYRTTQLIAGDGRFVLTSSGHILGVVNPPGGSSKRYYRAGPAAGCADADAWQRTVDRIEGSWWVDWMAWLSPRCGELQPASLTPQRFGAAPGKYVLEK